jgi:hypothetical protein
VNTGSGVRKTDWTSLVLLSLRTVRPFSDETLSKTFSDEKREERLKEEGRIKAADAAEGEQ